MADVITRLKLESGEYDSKIKRATQGLLQMEQECRKVGGTLAILEKDQTEFIKSLGKMQTVSTNARGKLTELTNAFTELSVQYNRLTKEEKQGDFGRALSSSLVQLKTRIRDARSELDGITRSLGKGGGGFNQLFSGVAGKFGMSPAMFTGVGAAIAGIGTAAKLAGDNIRTALNFEKSMSGLSALTGKTGKDLERLKEYAIELGSTTTLTASQVADAFRLIGSQQPQLLESSEALKEVTKYAIRLSEAAGIDLQTASQTLSTSINQMGGDSNKAARYVNVLAAASQKGAGDIAWLGEALTKSATAAKAVGTDYEELVANLEQLAKGGFDASTAGTALRSIIMNLEKQANKDFKPSIVGLTQAFENLGKAELDITGYQNIAGKMFATQAKVLADAAGEAKKMAEAITDTNIAEEQATTNTANLDGSLKSLASAWEGLNLHINSSNGFLKTCVDWLKDTVRWMDNTFTAAGRAKKALEDLRGGGETSNGRKIDTRTEYEVKEVKSAMQGEGDSAKVKQQQILDQYDRDIAAKQKELERAEAQVANAVKSGNYTSVATARNIKERLNNEVEALKTLRQEFKSASDALFAPQQAPAKTEITNTNNDGISDTGTSGGGGNTNKEKIQQELTPLQEVQKQITELSNEALTADNERLEVIRQQIEALQTQADEYKAIQDYVTKGITRDTFVDFNGNPFTMNEEDTSSTTEPDLTALDRAKQAIAAKLSEQNMLVDETTFSTLLQTAMQHSIDSLDPDFTSLQEKLAEGMNIPDEAWQSLQDKINEHLKELGIEPIKINFETGNLADEGKKTQDSWKGAASAVQSVGSAFSQIEDPAAKVAGTLAQAIASVALGYATATTQAASMGPWAWIAFAAAGLAQMVATISTIKSVTKVGYAEGGIVKGNSYSGDNIITTVGNDGSLAGLNAGEVVLTKAMQGNLASQLSDQDKEGLGNSEPYVTGEKIVLGINNWGKQTGRGQLVFSRS